MAKLVFVGDVHGKFERLTGILEEYSKSDRVYQLGDFGIGFPGKAVPDLPPNFRFIRGNHDNPEQARKHPNYLGDYGVDEFGVGFVSGAWSIDAYARTPGLDWWLDEQLNYKELLRAEEVLVEANPRIIISHCTTSAFEELLVPHSRYGSSTTQALDSVAEKVYPDYWICGHYHYTNESRIGSVRYRCLAELEVFELEI